MSQEKIESRRAFMKNVGKVSATVAVAAFLTSRKEVVAAPTEDQPTTGCGSSGVSCTAYCGRTCSGACRTGLHGSFKPPQF